MRPSPPNAKTALAQAWRHLRWEPGLWFVPMAVGGSFVLQLHEVEHGPVLCVSRLLLGLPCGGCGMTRAYVALAHGQWSTAIDYNPLAPLVFLWMVLWWTASVVALSRGQPPATSPRWAGLAGMVGFGALWVVRTVAFFLQPGWWAAIQQDALAARLLREFMG